jgi:hypothetical protein
MKILFLFTLVIIFCSCEFDQERKNINQWKSHNQENGYDIYGWVTPIIPTGNENCPPELCKDCVAMSGVLVQIADSTNDSTLVIYLETGYGTSCGYRSMFWIPSDHVKNGKLIKIE